MESPNHTARVMMMKSARLKDGGFTFDMEIKIPFHDNRKDPSIQNARKRRPGITPDMIINFIIYLDRTQ